MATKEVKLSVEFSKPAEIKMKTDGIEAATCSDKTVAMAQQLGGQNVTVLETHGGPTQDNPVFNELRR
jgi:hypothetical protein